MQHFVHETAYKAKMLISDHLITTFIICRHISTQQFSVPVQLIAFQRLTIRLCVKLCSLIHSQQSLLMFFSFYVSFFKISSLVFCRIASYRLSVVIWLFAVQWNNP